MYDPDLYAIEAFGEHGLLMHLSVWSGRISVSSLDQRLRLNGLILAIESVQ